MKIFQGNPVALNRKTRRTINAVYGLGFNGTHKILAFVGVQKQCLNIAILQEQYSILNLWFGEQIYFGTFLYMYMQQNRAKEIFMKTVKGSRMSFGLPIHGQRTRSNAKTAKRLQLSTKFIQQAKLNS